MLFLTWHFPPTNASACVRTGNIAKYLAVHGWDVTVVTPAPSLWRRLDAPAEMERSLERAGIRRLWTDHHWRCLAASKLRCSESGLGWLFGGLCRRLGRRWGVDTAIGWLADAERACGMLTRMDADVILVSGPPFVTFRLAQRLSRKLARPYVLDYRDPWIPTGPSWRVRHVERLEQRLVDESAAVTVITESLLKGRVRLDAGKMHVVTNGFDPDELNLIAPYPFGHFAIVYAGVFYPPVRVITPLMQALKRLAETGTHRIPWRFHYYGVHDDHVREEAQRYGVADKVSIHGHVSREEALSAVRGAGVAVVITSVLEENAEHHGYIVTGKLFEPLGMNVPVLLIGPAGADVDAIARTAGLVRQVTGRDVGGIVAYLSELMSGCRPPARTPEQYAWPNIVKKLDAVLRETVHASPVGARHPGALV